GAGEFGRNATFGDSLWVIIHSRLLGPRYRKCLTGLGGGAPASWTSAMSHCRWWEAGLFERLPGDRWRLTPGEQPAADGCGDWKAGQDHGEFCSGRGAGNNRSVAEPGDRGEVGDCRPGKSTKQAQRARSNRRQVAAGGGASPGGGEGAQVAGGLAADQP